MQSVSALVCTLSLFIVQLQPAYGDLPVHCVQPQVIGQWRFHIGHYGNGAGDSSCGFSAPDAPDGHWQLTPPIRDPEQKEKGKYYLTSEFKEAFTLDVELRDWTARATKVVGGEGKVHFPSKDLPAGTWTEVYDEGFHVTLGASDGDMHSFFAFHKYTISDEEGGEAAKSINTKDNAKHTDCHTTLLGWYKQLDPNSHGVKKQMCYWGERIGSIAPLPADKQAPAGTPPIVPVPVSDTGGAAKKVPEKKLERPSTRGGKGPSAPTTKSATPPLRLLLQIVLGLSTIASVAGFWNGLAPKRHSDRGVFFWRTLGLVGMLTLIIVGVSLWFMSHVREVDVVHKQATAGTSQKKGYTVKQMMDRTNEHLKQAEASNTTVRWQSNPEKMKKWMAEREKHGVQVTENSEIERLLDAISPPPVVGLPGFGVSESIGVVKSAAIAEQKRVADKLNKTVDQLTTADMNNVWGTKTHNHHEQPGRSFIMNGKPLGAEDWKTMTAFDWKDVSMQDSNGNVVMTNPVCAVPDQGPCGSCYATAATSMFTSRLMLRYPELAKKFRSGSRSEDRISVRQHLACNPYQQGCDGGYPYLMALWGLENDLVTDRCFEQMEAAEGNKKQGPRPDTCPAKGSSSSPECQGFTFRIENFRYVGGALGRCGMHHLCEAAIREELYKGGPMVVTIEPTELFWSYTGGIMHEIPRKAWEKVPKTTYTEESEIHAKSDISDCGDTECFIWRKVDHSVLLTGWNEDTSKGLSCQPKTEMLETEKGTWVNPNCEAAKTQQDCKLKEKECIWQGFQYWIVQNSYGPQWGEGGFMYLGPRGHDPIRVETMTVAADVQWVEAEEAGMKGKKFRDTKSSFAEEKRQGLKIGAVRPHTPPAVLPL